MILPLQAANVAFVAKLACFTKCYPSVTSLTFLGANKTTIWTVIDFQTLAYTVYLLFLRKVIFLVTLTLFFLMRLRAANNQIVQRVFPQDWAVDAASLLDASGVL